MRRWIVLAAVLIFAACSKDKDIDTPAKLVSFAPSLKVERVWSSSVNDKKGVDLRLGLGLALDGGRIYAAGHTGEIVALDAKTGRQVWRTKTKLPLSGGAGVGADMVAIGSSTGVVVALNAATGSSLWTVRLNGEVLSAPAISSRVVVFRTVDGKIHGLSPKDGHELWVQEQQVPRLSLRGTARPVVVGDVVLCGFDNGKVLAVNAGDGTVQWEATVAPPHGRTELERIVDIDSAVDVTGQDVYAVGFQGRIAMLALDTGQVWWSHDASSYRGLGMDDEALYMATADGEVVSMRRRTGAELWRQSAIQHRRLSAVAASGTTLVTADYQGYVHWIDKASGALAARARAGKARISSPPVTSGDMVYVINDKGGITAFRATPIPGAKGGPAATPGPGATSPAANDAAVSTPDTSSAAGATSTAPGSVPAAAPEAPASPPTSAAPASPAAPAAPAEAPAAPAAPAADSSKPQSPN